VSYSVAFSISFVVGVIMAYVLNAGFVFRARFSLAKMAKFPALYLLQYVMGLLLLRVLVDSVGLDERIAPLVNVALLTPVTFMINRWFLVQRGNDGAA
jgi:putative flippase GtrA